MNDSQLALPSHIYLQYNMATPFNLDKDYMNKLFCTFSSKNELEGTLETIQSQYKILFNKLTYLLEKMFVLDPTLFNNDKLGKKVRSFIENDLYKKYWLNNYILFDETFFMFINNHYRFLKFQQEEFGAVMGEIHQF